MQHWEWQATDRAAWHAMLPRWLASWGAADVLPRTTEYLSGRQLVVLDKGVAALRPRRDALDGMYRQGLIHVTQWRANSRTTTTLWVTHTPGQGTACIFCFRAKARVQDSRVIHVRLAGTDGGPEPLRLLLGLCTVLSLHDSSFPMQTAAVVLPAHLLPKYILEGVTDPREAEAARFTRLCEETGLLSRVSLTPKQRPARWAQQLSCVPAQFPVGWDYMFRTADFHRAQYFRELPSAALAVF